MIFNNTKNYVILLLGALFTHVVSPINNAVLIYKPTSMKKGIQIQLSKDSISYWDKEIKNEIRKTIIANPDSVLRENKIIEQELEKCISILTHERLEKEFLKNPLSLLSECTTGYCMLNRFKTKARKNFEENIIATVKSNPNLMAKDDITYTSFASGSFFQDLVILTKLIDFKGFKKINVNLIDREFKNYIDSLSAENTSISFDLFKDNDHQKENWLILKTYVLIQFLEWFADDIEMSVTIYDSTKSYIQECLNNPAIKSDIIVGVDYIEELWNPIIDFLALMLTTLKKDCQAFSLISAGMMAEVYVSALYKKITEPLAEEITSLAHLYLTMNSGEEFIELDSKIANIKKATFFEKNNVDKI